MIRAGVGVSAEVIDCVSVVSKCYSVCRADLAHPSYVGSDDSTTREEG